MIPLPHPLIDRLVAATASELTAKKSLDNVSLTVVQLLL